MKIKVPCSNRVYKPIGSGTGNWTLLPRMKTWWLSRLSIPPYLAGCLGFEPKLTVLETVVLPIGRATYLAPGTGLEPVTYWLLFTSAIMFLKSPLIHNLEQNLFFLLVYLLHFLILVFYMNRIILQELNSIYSHRMLQSSQFLYQYIYD